MSRKREDIEAVYRNRKASDDEHGRRKISIKQKKTGNISHKISNHITHYRFYSKKRSHQCGNKDCKVAEIQVLYKTRVLTTNVT